MDFFPFFLFCYFLCQLICSLLSQLIILYKMSDNPNPKDIQFSALCDKSMKEKLHLNPRKYILRLYTVYIRCTV